MHRDLRHEPALLSAIDKSSSFEGTRRVGVNAAERAGRFQAPLCALIERAMAVQFRAFETQPVDAFAPGLVARMGALLTDALSLFGAVFDEHQDEELLPQAAAGAPFLQEIDRLMEASSSRQRIADLCFVARMELRAKQQPLTALAGASDPWLVLSGCASARRKLIKSACAVEQALCELEGLKSQSASCYETELQTSLEVRRTYLQFRAEVLREGPPEPQVMVQRLRQAGVSIAKLVGRDVYENLRTDDRLQLRGFQSRLLAWLRAGDGAQTRTGLRIWQDLAAFAGMLVTVNNRAELRNHDRTVIAEVAQALTPLPDHAPLPDGLRRRLGAVQGRDDALDALLSSGAATVDECWALLEGVSEQLGAPPAVSSTFETPEANTPSAPIPPKPPAAADGSENT